MEDGTIQNNQHTDQSDKPRRIIFQKFNTETQKLEPDGSMRWNGQEWEVEEENRYNSIALVVNEIRGFGGRILTKKHRDFYMPFWHIPTTGTRVDVEPAPYPYRRKK